MERTTVRLPSELLARARKKAAAEGRTLTSLIEEGLKGVVARRQSAPQSPRARAPISSVRGRVRPGIDLNNSAGLEDLLDESTIDNMGMTKLK